MNGKRFAPGTFISGDYLYAFGGELRSIERYNLVTFPETWEKLPITVPFRLNSKYGFLAVPQYKIDKRHDKRNENVFIFGGE